MKPTSEGCGISTLSESPMLGFHKQMDNRIKLMEDYFFQAEDGIRDHCVTGVQTCALPISGARREEMAALRWRDIDFQWGSLWIKDKVVEEGRKVPLTPYLASLLTSLPRRNQWVRSEERRVGKECRCRWTPTEEKRYNKSAV